MTKFDICNRKSYFSALLSMSNLIENSKENMKMHKMNNLDGAIKLIKFCIMHIDDFIKYGDLLDFCFYTTVQQNEKKLVNARLYRQMMKEQKNVLSIQNKNYYALIVIEPLKENFVLYKYSITVII